MRWSSTGRWPSNLVVWRSATRPSAPCCCGVSRPIGMRSTGKRRVLADQQLAEPLVRDAAQRAEYLGRPVVASWTRPSSMHDALAFFAQTDPAVDRVLWLRPSSGEALVGIGAAHVLTGHGIGRFRQVSAAWRALLADAVVDDASATPDGGPLLVGGFRFDPLGRPAAIWKTFTDGADARLVLPRHMLALRGGAAWLTTNVLVSPERLITEPSQDRPLAADAGPPSGRAPL